MRGGARSESEAVHRSGLLTVYGVGLTSGLFVDLGGQLYIAEIVLAGIALVALLGGGWVWPPSIIRFALLAFLWGVGCVLSSLYNVSSPADTQKVLAGIAITTTSLLGFARVVRSRRDVLHALVALGLGRLVGFVVQPDPLASVAPWKFGVGFAITLLAIVLASRLPAGPAVLLIA